MFKEKKDSKFWQIALRVHNFQKKKISNKFHQAYLQVKKRINYVHPNWKAVNNNYLYMK